MTILSWEPELIEMPEDACHSHGAVAPWWTKVEIKIVILNIGIARDTSLQTRELDVDMEETFADTVVTCPPLRCCATDLAMAGFSATQRILRAMPSSHLSCDNLHDACYDLVPYSKSLSSIYEAIHTWDTSTRKERRIEHSARAEKHGPCSKD